MTGSKYERLVGLPPDKFRRLTGVKPTVFTLMVAIPRKSEKQKRKRGGKLPDLTLEDRLLMSLEYLREYRTYFHIAESYGVSESTAYRTCRWVEDTLVKDKRLALPGRKALLKSDNLFVEMLHLRKNSQVAGVVPHTPHSVRPLQM